MIFGIFCFFILSAIGLSFAYSDDNDLGQFLYRMGMLCMVWIGLVATILRLDAILDAMP